VLLRTAEFVFAMGKTSDRPTMRRRNGITSQLAVCGRLLAAAVFLCVSALGAQAQEDTRQHQIKAASGRDARVAVYTNIRPDCTSGPLPAIRLVANPTHGAVTAKRGTFKATNVKQCLAIEVPALVVFYKSTGDYIGADEFEFEVTLGGRKKREHFQVNVSTNPGGGQGI